MDARYYDPVIGRFYSNDPIGFTGNPHTFNRYSYVSNNPYKYTDPTGESGLAVFLASPKTVIRLTPAARGVRQAMNNGQLKTNPLQQQTQKIANQMRETVKNSKPEVRQSSLKEAPKAMKDTGRGIIVRLIKQLGKHADDFAGSISGATISPEGTSSENMSNDTKRLMATMQILTNPAPTVVIPEAPKA